MNIVKKILIFIFTFYCFQCSKTILSSNQFYESNISFSGTDDVLDIVTWNIENFPKNNETTVNFLSDIIPSLNVDIIALQEIGNGNNAFNTLLSNLGNRWVGYLVSSGNNNYGRLAYLINTQNIDNIIAPINILENENEELFAWRYPYLLEFYYKNQHFILINVHYKCCGDGILNLNNSYDEEYKRYHVSEFIHAYVKSNYNDKNVVILGDFNDFINDEAINNVFTPYTNTLTEYIFADFSIAYGSSDYWSYPDWPTFLYRGHIDHIMLSNEIFDNFIYTSETILLDNYFPSGILDYVSHISDHRPVVVNINVP